MKTLIGVLILAGVVYVAWLRLQKAPGWKNYQAQKHSQGYNWVNYSPAGETGVETLDCVKNVVLHPVKQDLLVIEYTNTLGVRTTANANASYEPEIIPSAVQRKAPYNYCVE